MDNLDLPKLPDSEIESLAAVARDELQKLKLEAEKLEADAAAAVKAFETKPTAATATSKEVAKQLAVNARTKLNESVAQAEPLMQERNRRVQLRRFNELRAKVEWRPLADASAARIAHVFDTFREALAAELKVLTDQTAARNALVGEVNGLESSVGNGDRHREIETGYIVDFINDRLAQHFGSITVSNHDGAEFVQVTHYATGSMSALNIQQRIAVSHR